ncbi:MAG: glycosyltransferase [Saprospiraceae bacterium]|nr:glycosyltransferase [Saprospiraceae bacterium]
MKVLQVCKKFPFPSKDGESIAILQMSKALSDAGCEMSLLAMNTTKHFVEIKNNFPEELSYYKEIQCVEVDNRIKWHEAFLNLFSKESYNISRFVSEEFRTVLINMLKNNSYDIIQLETLYLAPFIQDMKKYSNAIIVLRAHNIEHEIWLRIADQVNFLPKKIYLSYLSKKLKNYELEILNDYDFLVAITDRDLVQFRSLGYKNGCTASPVGLNMNLYPVDYDVFRKPLALSFIGSLDWLPNAEAVRWFLKKAWPELHKSFPELSFHFAGRNAPDDLKAFTNLPIKYYGDVADAKAFIKNYPIMIVPIFAGSGIRVKILEAMALGRVVITTSIGLEGIAAKHMQEVIIANSVEDMIKSIQYCYDNPDQLQKIGEKAHKFVQSHFDNQKLGLKLHQAYKKVLATHIK